MDYAAIHIPEFPVVAWLRSDSGVRLRAQAVIEGTAPLQRVVSINRAAKAQGVSRGISKVQAEATGPLLFRNRCIEEETAAFQVALEVAERFSPRIQALAEPSNQYAQAHKLSVSLLLDRTGTETLFGSAEQYAQRLKAELGVANFPCSIAACQNAEASLLLARSHSGVTAVQANDVAKRLAPLPLSLLPCDATTLTVFTRWGVRTLGELAALPEASLISRIGQQARRLQRLARGVEDHLLVPEEPDLILSETASLDTPLFLLDSLLFVMSPMLERMMRRATEHAYALRSLTLALQLEKADPYERHIRPAIAPQTAQRGLFQAQFPEPDKLEILLARLRSIAGEQNVGAPELKNSHRDDEVTMAAFCPSVIPGDFSRVKPSCLALRRFRPSQPIRVTLKNGIPSLLFWQGQRVELAEVKGPWQSSGYWWDGRTWETDEWDVIALQPLYALRLRYECGPKSWAVVGVYD
jgi:protein ImuB